MSDETMSTMFERFTCVHTDSASALDEALQAGGYDVIELRGAAIDDKASLFRQVGHDLPGDDEPPTRSWDALADWIWQRLAARRSNHIAVVWSDAHVLLNSSLPSFLKAVQIVGDISRQAEEGEGGFPHPADIVLCLVGDAPGFPPLAA